MIFFCISLANGLKIDWKAGCINGLNEDKPQVFEINLLEEEEGSLCKLQIKLS